MLRVPIDDGRGRQQVPQLRRGGAARGTTPTASANSSRSCARTWSIRPTLISELEPEEAVSRLEPALTAMRAAVRQFGGIVSKELGHGLAAVFGAPIADDNHAPLACHAALELVRRVEGLGDPDLKSGSASTRDTSSPTSSTASFPRSTRSVVRRSIWRLAWKRKRDPARSMRRRLARSLPKATFSSSSWDQNR